VKFARAICLDQQVVSNRNLRHRASLWMRCDVAKPSMATVMVGIGLAAGSRLAVTVYQVASRM
jgi:hypothetical protein